MSIHDNQPPSHVAHATHPGKPHPRWVDSANGFRGGDHESAERRAARLSRSARGSARHEQDSRSQSSGSDHHDGSLALEAVKSEPLHDPSQSPLYTMSPSYEHTQVPGEQLSYFDVQRRAREQYSPISPGITTNYSGSPFTDDSSSSYFGGGRAASSHVLPFGAAGAASSSLQLPPPQCGSQCGCVSNSSATPCLASLSHQLQSTMSILRHLPEHAAVDVPCHVYRRISDLQASLRYAATPPHPLHTRANPHPSYSTVINPRSATLPAYSALATSAGAGLPASLSHAHSHGGDTYRNGHDWHTVSTPTYQTYTSLATAQDHGMYSSKNVAYSVAA